MFLHQFQLTSCAKRPTRLHISPRVPVIRRSTVVIDRRQAERWHRGFGRKGAAPGAVGTRLPTLQQIRALAGVPLPVQRADALVARCALLGEVPMQQTPARASPI